MQSVIVFILSCRHHCLLCVWIQLTLTKVITASSRFVCANSTRASSIVRLCSYPSQCGSAVTETATIWEVARATSAATSFFDHITIGQHKQRFADGALGANNPVWEVWGEAREAWPSEIPLEKRIGCFVSIGTGKLGSEPLGTWPWEVARSLKDLCTETEETADKFASNNPNLLETGRYYRFNVEQGLEKVGLAEVQEKAAIADFTHKYLNRQKIRVQVQACVKAMSRRKHRNSPSWLSISVVLMLLVGLASVYFSHVVGPNNPSLPPANWEHADELLLKNGFDPRGGDVSGLERHGLHWAAPRGLETVVSLLLYRGVPVDTRDKSSGRTVLHQAAEVGNEAMVKLLLDRGAHVNAGDKYGETALSLAARNGHQVIVGLLLERGADATARTRFSGPRLLYHMVERGNVNITRLLVQYGAPTDARTLNQAVKQNSTEMVELLLRSRPDVDDDSDGGKVALRIAAMKGHSDVAQVLLRHGARVDPKDECGLTPLHWALLNGHAEVVGILVENGADAHTRAAEGEHFVLGPQGCFYNDGADLIGTTTLHLAAGATLLWQNLPWGLSEANKSEAACEMSTRIMLEREVDVKAKGTRGETPLYWAVKNGFRNVTKLLLSAGADVNAKSRNGQTALHEASSAAMVYFLTDQGADPNARNTRGMTPLHFAAMHSNAAVAEALLACGADVDARDDLDKSAMAEWGFNREMLRLFLQHYRRQGKSISPQDLHRIRNRVR